MTKTLGSGLSVEAGEPSDALEELLATALEHPPAMPFARMEKDSVADERTRGELADLVVLAETIKALPLPQPRRYEIFAPAYQGWTPRQQDASQEQALAAALALDPAVTGPGWSTSSQDPRDPDVAELVALASAIRALPRPVPPFSEWPTRDSLSQERLSPALGRGTRTAWMKGPALRAAVVLALLLIGWTAVAPSVDAALPGQGLYPLKRLEEQVILATSGSAWPAHRLAQAEARLVEAQAPALPWQTRVSLVAEAASAASAVNRSLDQLPPQEAAQARAKLEQLSLHEVTVAPSAHRSTRDQRDLAALGETLGVPASESLLELRVGLARSGQLVARVTPSEPPVAEAQSDAASVHLVSAVSMPEPPPTIPVLVLATTTPSLAQPPTLSPLAMPEVAWAASRTDEDLADMQESPEVGGPREEALREPTSTPGAEPGPPALVAEQLRLARNTAPRAVSTPARPTAAPKPQPSRPVREPVEHTTELDEQTSEHDAPARGQSEAWGAPWRTWTEPTRDASTPEHAPTPADRSDGQQRDEVGNHERAPAREEPQTRPDPPGQSERRTVDQATPPPTPTTMPTVTPTDTPPTVTPTDTPTVAPTEAPARVFEKPGRGNPGGPAQKGASGRGPAQKGSSN